MPELHEELAGSVIEIDDWGFLVRLSGGQVGFLDQTKAPARIGEGPPLRVGDEITVAVLDDQRSPCRLSALTEDIEIARSRRRGRH